MQTEFISQRRATWGSSWEQFEPTERAWKKVEAPAGTLQAYIDAVIQDGGNSYYSGYRILDAQHKIVWSDKLIVGVEDGIEEINWRVIKNPRQLDAVIVHKLGWRGLQDGLYANRVFVGYAPGKHDRDVVPEYSGEHSRRLLRPYLSWRIEYQQGQGYRCSIESFVPALTADNENTAIALAWLEMSEAQE